MRTKKQILDDQLARYSDTGRVAGYSNIESQTALLTEVLIDIRDLLAEALKN